MVLNCNAIADEIGRVNGNNKERFASIVFSSSAMMQRLPVCPHSDDTHR